MRANEKQAVEDEQAGAQEVQEDIDYDSLYGGLDVQVSDIPKSKELKNSYAEVFKDVAKQGIKETLIGAGGAYGDLLELAGLNGKEAQEKKHNKEFQALENLETPGKGSFEDFESLSENDEVPKSFSLPTSKNLRDANEYLGGPGEPETHAGKYAARTGKLYGAGLAFGQINPAPAAVGGVLGQGVEDLGGGPLAQASAEIVGMLLTPGGGAKTLVSSGKKQVQQKISELRKLGYSDENITLAINSAYKNSKTAKLASKGQKTEQAFESFAENSEKIVQDILSAEIPGIERGTKHVHELASDVYGAMAKEGSTLTITNSRPFLDASKKVVDQIENTLGKNPEAQAFVKRISEAAMEATQYPSAEKMMNFYKELNSMGNWLGRSQKDRLISQVKEGIKDTFKSEGKKGKELAAKFEEANVGIRKAYQAEEVHDLIQKSTTQNGIDFKKFNKIFDKPDNVKLFSEVLGPQQTKNLNLVSNVASQVKDFDKSWKIANSFSVGSTADTIRGAAASYYIYKGDWEGLAKVAATKLGTIAIKKIAEKSLADPKFQNLLIKGLHAVKVESPKLMKSANEALNKYLQDEGIDLDQVKGEGNSK